MNVDDARLENDRSGGTPAAGFESRRQRCVLATAMALAALALAGCATTVPVASEPLNLSVAKEAAIAYAEGGRYDQDLADVAREARAWLAQRAARRAPGERLAVVFDLDETLLSNYRHMRSQDFGYVPYVWNDWVARAEAPSIAPVKEVYDDARRLGLAIFFITGRQEPRDRPGTEENLRREGLGHYERLVLAPDDGARLTTAQRKTAIRASIEAEGHRIVANLGDQASDLEGGHAERTFKLPNPFYLIP
jgi:predicted secreted acid phosphatase